MSARMLGRLVLAAGLMLGALPASARNDLPQARVAVVVGNNEGHDPARALKYAEQEVGRLARLLKDSGDFGSVLLVPGGARAEVEQALAAARAQLVQAKASGQPTLFLFYYSGHGDDEALELGSSRLPLRDLRGYLENLSAADVRLGFVDACQSGALTGVKGGRRAPDYHVRLADPGQIKGMAIVTSSTANELSQESDDLRGSYFSHNVVAGLLGAADASGDGRVTLGELYQYAFTRTLANTAASLVGGQHPTYDYRMAGAGDVVLTRARGADARIRFPRETGATYTVFQSGREEVLAELTSSSSDELYLALPAGSYRLVRRTLGSVSERSVGLFPGATARLEPDTMTPVVLAQNTLRKKGGDIAAVTSGAAAGRLTTVGVQMGAVTPLLPGSTSPVLTFGVSLSRFVTPWLALRLRGEISSFDVGQSEYRSSVTRVAPAFDVLLPIVAGERLSVMIGPSTGVPIMRQSLGSAVEPSQSYGLSWGGLVVAAVRVAGGVWVTGQATAGGEFYRLDGARTHRPTAGLALGALHSF